MNWQERKDEYKFLFVDAQRMSPPNMLGKAPSNQRLLACMMERKQQLSDGYPFVFNTLCAAKVLNEDKKKVAKWIEAFLRISLIRRVSGVVPGYRWIGEKSLERPASYEGSAT